MATYISPRVMISQQFTSVPVFSQNPLAALIIGPQYDLNRYSVAAEKSTTIPVHPTVPANANNYQSGVDVTYAYPSQPVGSVVDLAYNKLYAENVVAKYFPHATLGSASDVVTKVTNYPNRVASAALVFQTANGTSRSSVFSNRDVQVGDVVHIDDAGSNSMTTKVAGFVPAPVAAVIAASTGDTNNKANASEDYNNSPVWVGSGGAPGTVTIANSSTAYKGHSEYGIVDDTYTVTVTTGGNLSAVRFSIASANGAFALKTNVALATAILTIDDSNNNDVQLDFTSSTAFTSGDAWTVSVVAPVVRVNPTSGGTYVGTSDLTYKITVTRGGPFYTGSNPDTCAVVAITSTNIDSSGPVSVASATPIAVGTNGVTATWSSAVNNGGLVLGDVYYIAATAATNGAVRTLVLEDVLTDALLSASTLHMTLSVLQPTYRVPAVRSLSGNTVNWSSSASGVTVKAGMVTHDALLTYGISQVDLPVTSASLFIEHRDLVQDNVISISSVNSVGSVSSAVGTIDVDNPLAQGVYEAALNAAGVPVHFLAVATNDLAGYNAALETAQSSYSVYGVVPLSTDPAIQNAVVGSVNAMSTPQKARWRTAWLSIPLAPTALIYDTQSGGANWTATITQDPLATAGTYTLVTMTGATFVTSGIRAGDTVLTNFSLAPDGSALNDTYTVASVRSQTTLVLASGPSTPVSVATKTQIQRNYSANEQVNNLAASVSAYSNRRVRVIVPDYAKNGSITLPGTMVAAALAGLRSGVAPQQGITNIQLLGFTDVGVTRFTEEQLDTLAAAGAMIVTQSIVGATPYVRHQLTTDTSSVNTSEDSITANVDSISYGMQRVMAPYIGKYNRNPETMILIRNAINNELRYRQSGTAAGNAGNQLIGFTIDSLTPNLTFNDRIDVAITLQVPYPINYIYLTFTV